VMVGGLLGGALALSWPALLQSLRGRALRVETAEPASAGDTP
jgi:hypothetical protein